MIDKDRSEIYLQITTYYTLVLTQCIWVMALWVLMNMNKDWNEITMLLLYLCIFPYRMPVCISFILAYKQVKSS